MDLRARRALRDLAQRFIDDVIATVLAGGGEEAAGPAGRPRRRVRRRAHKLEELRETVLAALGERGGVSIGAIARHIGSTPRELSRPIAVLLAEGRIIKTGERKGTRYSLEAKRDGRARSLEPKREARALEPSAARRATPAAARRTTSSTAARRIAPAAAARRGASAAHPSSKKKPARARPKRGR